MSTPNSASSGSHSPKEDVRINCFGQALQLHCTVLKFHTEFEESGEATPSDLKTHYKKAVDTCGYWSDEILLCREAGGTPDPRIKQMRDKMAEISIRLYKAIQQEKERSFACLTGACESLGLDKCCCIRKRSKVHSI